MSIPGNFIGALALTALLAFSLLAPAAVGNVKLDEQRDNLQVVHEGRVITVE